ncbi:MAG: TonB-dependent receptor [Synechococcales cyanobacterium]
MVNTIARIPVGGSLLSALVLLLAAATLSTQPASAQTEIAPETNTDTATEEQLDTGLSNRLLQQSVTTPSRRQTPLTQSSRPVYVITREEMQEQGARTVQEALRYLPGVLSDGTVGNQLGALSGQFLRGSSSPQVLILLDGRPLNDLAVGGFDLSTLTTDAVERIELSPGGGSTLYGSDAIGGVINIVTLRPEFRDPGSSQTVARVGVGSYGFNEQGIIHRGTAQDLGWVVSYQRYQATQDFPFRSTANPGTRTNADVAYDNLALSLVVEQERQRFGFTTRFTNKDVGVPGSTQFPSLTDRQFTHNLHSDLTWELLLDPGSQLLWRVYADTLSLQFVSGSTFQTQSQTYGSQLQHVWQINPSFTLTSGLDIRTTSAANRTLEGGQVTAVSYDNTVTQTALFSRVDWTLAPQLLLNIGLRQDWNSLANGAATSPALGIRWQVSDSTALRANYSRSFRVPLLSDLFFAADFGGFVVQGNPNLKPERGESLDLGVDQQLGPDALLRLTWSTSRVQDAINFVFFDDFSGGTYENIDEVDNTSWEAALAWQLAPGWILNANATLNDPRIRAAGDPATIGKERAVTGADSYMLSLTYRDPEHWTAGLYLRHVGRFFTNNTNTAELPGFTTVAFQAGIPLSEAVTLKLGVDNLFDHQYEVFPGYPALGRTVRLGLNATF